jgi:hypothetical protein
VNTTAALCTNVWIHPETANRKMNKVRNIFLGIFHLECWNADIKCLQSLNFEQHNVMDAAIGTPLAIGPGDIVV